MHSMAALANRTAPQPESVTGRNGRTKAPRHAAERCGASKGAATMPTWHPASEAPTLPETAVIATKLPNEYSPDAMGGYFILDEMYRFDLKLQRWLGETSGLLLRHESYWWMRENDLLAGLPQ